MPPTPEGEAASEPVAVAVDDRALRPALEAALEVAQAAVAATPPLTPPRQLRPFLGVRRLPDRAMAPVRRALENDEVFRRLVAASTTEQLVGEVSWLWLSRPEGWVEQIEVAAAAKAAELAAATDAKGAAAAVRRLTAVEAALRKAEAAATSARAERDRAREQAADERRRRTLAESELGRARVRIAELEAQPRSPAGPTGSDPARDPIRDALEAEVARLGDLLDRARTQLPGVGSDAAEGESTGERRQPVPLPPALFDDTVEAAEHLVRVPGMLVFVDGYNVTKRTWPDLSIGDQRQWLLDGVAALAARTNAEVHVVFDGAGGRTTAPAVGPRRANVHLRFTAEGLEADDELLAMVGAASLRRPVTVVSSDARVVTGAAELGANTVPADVFASLLRR